MSSTFARTKRTKKPKLPPRNAEFVSNLAEFLASSVTYPLSPVSVAHLQLHLSKAYIERTPETDKHCCVPANALHQWRIRFMPSCTANAETRIGLQRQVIITEQTQLAITLCALDPFNPYTWSYMELSILADFSKACMNASADDVAAGNASITASIAAAMSLLQCQCMAPAWIGFNDSPSQNTYADARSTPSYQVMRNTVFFFLTAARSIPSLSTIDTSALEQEMATPIEILKQGRHINTTHVKFSKQSLEQLATIVYTVMQKKPLTCNVAANYILRIASWSAADLIEADNYTETFLTPPVPAPNSNMLIGDIMILALREKRGRSLIAMLSLGKLELAELKMNGKALADMSSDQAGDMHPMDQWRIICPPEWNITGPESSVADAFRYTNIPFVELSHHASATQDVMMTEWLGQIEVVPLLQQKQLMIYTVLNAYGNNPTIFGAVSQLYLRFDQAGQALIQKCSKSSFNDCLPDIKLSLMSSPVPGAQQEYAFLSNQMSYLAFQSRRFFDWDDPIPAGLPGPAASQYPEIMRQFVSLIARYSVLNEQDDVAQPINDIVDIEHRDIVQQIQNGVASNPQVPPIQMAANIQEHLGLNDVMQDDGAFLNSLFGKPTNAQPIDSRRAFASEDSFDQFVNEGFDFAPRSPLNAPQIPDKQPNVPNIIQAASFVPDPKEHPAMDTTENPENPPSAQIVLASAPKDVPLNAEVLPPMLAVSEPPPATQEAPPPMLANTDVDPATVNLHTVPRQIDLQKALLLRSVSTESSEIANPLDNVRPNSKAPTLESDSSSTEGTEYHSATNVSVGRSSEESNPRGKRAHSSTASNDRIQFTNKRREPLQSSVAHSELYGSAALSKTLDHVESTQNDDEFKKELSPEYQQRFKEDGIIYLENTAGLFQTLLLLQSDGFSADEAWDIIHNHKLTTDLNVRANKTFDYPRTLQTKDGIKKMTNTSLKLGKVQTSVESLQHAKSTLTPQVRMAFQNELASSSLPPAAIDRILQMHQRGMTAGSIRSVLTGTAVAEDVDEAQRITSLTKKANPNQHAGYFVRNVGIVNDRAGPFTRDSQTFPIAPNATLAQPVQPSLARQPAVTPTQTSSFFTVPIAAVAVPFKPNQAELQFIPAPMDVSQVTPVEVSNGRERELQKEIDDTIAGKKRKKGKKFRHMSDTERKQLPREEFKRLVLLEGDSEYDSSDDEIDYGHHATSEAQLEFLSKRVPPASLSASIPLTPFRLNNAGGISSAVTNLAATAAAQQQQKAKAPVDTMESQNDKENPGATIIVTQAHEPVTALADTAVAAPVPLETTRLAAEPLLPPPVITVDNSAELHRRKQQELTAATLKQTELQNRHLQLQHENTAIAKKNAETQAQILEEQLRKQRADADLAHKQSVSYAAKPAVSMASVAPVNTSNITHPTQAVHITHTSKARTQLAMDNTAMRKLNEDYSKNREAKALESNLQSDASKLASAPSATATPAAPTSFINPNPNPNSWVTNRNPSLGPLPNVYQAPDSPDSNYDITEDEIDKMDTYDPTTADKKTRRRQREINWQRLRRDYAETHQAASKELHEKKIELDARQQTIDDLTSQVNASYAELQHHKSESLRIVQEQEAAHDEKIQKHTEDYFEERSKDQAKHKDAIDLLEEEQTKTLETLETLTKALKMNKEDLAANMLSAKKDHEEEIQRQQEVHRDELAARDKKINELLNERTVKLKELQSLSAENDDFENLMQEQHNKFTKQLEEMMRETQSNSHSDVTKLTQDFQTREAEKQKQIDDMTAEHRDTIKTMMGDAQRIQSELKTTNDTLNRQIADVKKQLSDDKVTSAVERYKLQLQLTDLTAEKEDIVNQFRAVNEANALYKMELRDTLQDNNQLRGDLLKVQNEYSVDYVRMIQAVSEAEALALEQSTTYKASIDELLTKEPSAPVHKMLKKAVADSEKIRKAMEKAAEKTKKEQEAATKKYQTQFMAQHKKNEEAARKQSEKEDEIWAREHAMDVSEVSANAGKKARLETQPTEKELSKIKKQIRKQQERDPSAIVDEDEDEEESLSDKLQERTKQQKLAQAAALAHFGPGKPKVKALSTAFDRNMEQFTYKATQLAKLAKATPQPVDEQDHDLIPYDDLPDDDQVKVHWSKPTAASKDPRKESATSIADKVTEDTGYAMPMVKDLTNAEKVEIQRKQQAATEAQFRQEREKRSALLQQAEEVAKQSARELEARRQAAVEAEEQRRQEAAEEQERQERQEAIQREQDEKKRQAEEDAARKQQRAQNIKDLANKPLTASIQPTPTASAPSTTPMNVSSTPIEDASSSVMNTTSAKTGRKETTNPLSSSQVPDSDMESDDEDYTAQGASRAQGQGKRNKKGLQPEVGARRISSDKVTKAPIRGPDKHIPTTSTLFEQTKAGNAKEASEAYQAQIAKQANMIAQKTVAQRNLDHLRSLPDGYASPIAMKGPDKPQTLSDILEKTRATAEQAMKLKQEKATAHEELMQRFRSDPDMLAKKEIEDRQHMEVLRSMTDFDRQALHAADYKSLNPDQKRQRNMLARYYENQAKVADKRGLSERDIVAEVAGRNATELYGIHSAISRQEALSDENFVRRVRNGKSSWEEAEVNDARVRHAMSYMGDDDDDIVKYRKMLVDGDIRDPKTQKALAEDMVYSQNAADLLEGQKIEHLPEREEFVESLRHRRFISAMHGLRHSSRPEREELKKQNREYLTDEHEKSIGLHQSFLNERLRGDFTDSRRDSNQHNLVEHMLAHDYDDSSGQTQLRQLVSATFQSDYLSHQGLKNVVHSAPNDPKLMFPTLKEIFPDISDKMINYATHKISSLYDNTTRVKDARALTKSMKAITQTIEDEHKFDAGQKEARAMRYMTTNHMHAIVNRMMEIPENSAARTLLSSYLVSLTNPYV